MHVINYLSTNDERAHIGADKIYKVVDHVAIFSHTSRHVVYRPSSPRNHEALKLCRPASFSAQNFANKFGGFNIVDGSE